MHVAGLSLASELQEWLCRRKIPWCYGTIDIISVVEGRIELTIPDIL